MLSFLLLAAVLWSAPQQIESGADVIRAMHDRYAGQWYENLALIQTVNYYDVETGGVDSVRVWYESIRLPVTVRSDMAPLESGNCIMFKGQAWITFEADTIISNNPGPHPLLLLGFDVYVQPVEETLAILEAVRFDLSLVRNDTWEGREHYVVGAEGREFWIDVETLLFSRLYLKNPGTGAEREILFEAYEQLGGGWIATEIKFMRNGRIDMWERYDYWTIEVEFADDLFAMSERSRPTWVKN
jgi:hypothetical protein